MTCVFCKQLYEFTTCVSLQLLVVTVTRLLQTSLANAAMGSDPLSPAMGYLFDCEACMSTSDKDSMYLLCVCGGGVGYGIPV